MKLEKNRAQPWAFIFMIGLTILSGGFNNAHADQPLPEFTRDIEPILSRRCTVCHSCTEAPCQLKLSSFKGILRGSSKEEILSTPLSSRSPMRIKDFVANGDKDPLFSPVIPLSPSANRAQNISTSILFHAITAGMKNQLGAFDANATLPYYQKDQVTCPSNVSEYETFITKNPDVGMPLGLPALSQQEYDTLVTWIENGAPGPSANEQAKRLSVKNPEVIKQWEEFFNRPSLRDRLVSRYLFEHFGGMRFHFKENPGQFFELVRSRTNSPRVISEIVTETTAHDPGTTEFFYRLQKLDDTPVKKNHIVFDTDLKEIERLTQLFSSSGWSVQQAPAYTGNPFQDFAAIPAAMRARFMITHSQLLIDQMVRGTVCVGASATYAIRDHFWVMFLAPEADPSVVNPSLGLHRIFSRHNRHGISTKFTEISNYQNKFEDELRKLRPEGLGLEDIWSDQDANARVTVFRHENISSAHKGWIGGRPLTTWVLSYSNFERLYYNLVTNYKYWGTLVHRARTWDLMRTIRQEGEELFISLLPPGNRDRIRNQWTNIYSLEQTKTNATDSKLASSELDEYANRSASRGSRINIQNSIDPVGDLLAQLDRRIPKLPIEENDSLNQNISVGVKPPPLAASIQNASTLSFADFESGLRSLTNRSDLAFAHVIPSMTVIRIHDDVTNQTRVYTVLANRAFKGHPNPMAERKERMKTRDTISVFPGIVGSHPNLFIDLQMRTSGGSFLSELASLKDGEMNSFKAKYGVGRDHPDFWKFNDWLNDWYLNIAPVHGARLDLNHYDNGSGYL